MADDKRIKARIQHVIKQYEQDKHPDWDRYVDLYALEHYDKRVSDQERVTVGLTFAVVNVILPSLVSTNPRITVNPTQPSAIDVAPIQEAVVNFEWRHLKVKNPVREAVRDGLITGTGWVKVGWRRAESEKKRVAKKIESDFLEAKSRRDEAKRQYQSEGRKDLADSLPDDNDLFISIPTTQFAITRDDLFVERVNFKDVFVDPEACSLNDAKYIFQRVVKPLEDVLANPNYRYSDALAGLKPDAQSAAYGEVGRAANKDLIKDIRRVTLYEYWDIQNRTFAVYAESIAEPLYGPVEWPYPFLPFVPFRDHVVPNVFHGIGEIEAIEGLQRELDKTRSQMLNQRRQFNRKVIFKENAFLPQHVTELRSDRDGVFVPVRANVPLSEAIHILQPPTIDAQLYQVDQTIKDDITQITSVSEYQRGVLPNLRRTATESSIIESASSVRAQDKMSAVEDFMADIARNMLILMQKYYTEERAVRVVGADGAQVWFTYNGDFIDGEFDLEVEAGSAQPRNDSVRKQESLQLYQMLAGNPVVDQTELVKYVLRAHRIPDAVKLIAPPPPTAPPDGLPPELAAAGGAGAGAPPAQGGAPTRQDMANSLRDTHTIEQLLTKA